MKKMEKSLVTLPLKRKIRKNPFMGEHIYITTEKILRTAADLLSKNIDSAM